MADYNIKLISVSDVAKMFSVSERTIKRLIEKGELKGYKIGGSWRVDINSCHNYLDKYDGDNINK